ATLCHAGRAFLRRYRWECGLCLLSLALAVAPGFGNFRWSFRWLPFFFLTLGLVAAHALAELRARREGAAAPNLGVWSTFLVALVWARASLLGTDPTSHTFLTGIFLTGLSLLWAIDEGRRPATARVRTWVPCAVVLAVGWFSYANVFRFLEVPGWAFGESFRQTGPFDPARRYLSVHTRSDMIRADATQAGHAVRGVGAELRP